MEKNGVDLKCPYYIYTVKTRQVGIFVLDIYRLYVTVVGGEQQG